MERLKREGSEGRKSQFLGGILVGGWLRGGDIGVNLGVGVFREGIFLNEFLMFDFLEKEKLFHS